MYFKNTSKITFLNPREISSYQIKNDTSNIWNIIPSQYWHNLIELNGIKYYYKAKKKINLLNELVGEKISLYYNIPTVKSKIVSYENIKNINLKTMTFALVTKLFFESGLNYIKITNFQNEINCERINIYNLDNLNKYINPSNNDTISIDEYYFKILKKDLQKLIIRDYITDQDDRHDDNFLFGCSNSYVELAPLYDYEQAFLDRVPYVNKFNFNLENSYDFEYVKNDDYIKYLLHQTMEMNIKNILEEIEEEYQIIIENEEQENYCNIINKKKELIRKSNII